MEKGQSLGLKRLKEYAVLLMTIGNVERNQGKIDNAMYWYNESTRETFQKNGGQVKSL